MTRPLQHLGPICAALAFAGAALPASGEAPGFSASDRRAFVRHVERCWNTAGLPRPSQDVQVVVGLALTDEGRAAPGGVRLIGGRGADPVVTRAIVKSFQRAVDRCGLGDYGPAAVRSGVSRVEFTLNLPSG